MMTVHGTLQRGPGGFVLKADDGMRWRLELGRTPVDLVEKRVRAEGMAIEEDLLQVSALALDAG